MRNTAAKCFVWGCALIVAGCSFAHFESPHFSVVKIDLLDSDVLSQHFRLRLLVQNPNDRELPVRAITLKLELAGEPFGDGVTGEDFVVPAHGEAEFDLDLTTNLAGALLHYAGRKDKGADSIEYRLSGKVDLASGMVRSIPFSDSGQLPIH
ncbi:MAG TPA: LEA type 2 family protein [Steroidobacteraceae bacterium]|nr:LEA type 2 family protein [Steroidobacteraceae bacterium]